MSINSKELITARREEIINACEQLYKTMNFKDITIKEIGNVTSFKRTSIYNYFQTKEEIFLALMQREYDLWNDDLYELLNENSVFSIDELADTLAHSLEKRVLLLKLLAMNLYDIEENSRTEKLTEFKHSYKKAINLLECILEKFCSNLSAQERQEFIYAFLPFLFGVYPYTFATEKQIKAMDNAKHNYPDYSIYELIVNFVKKLFKGIV